MRFPVTKLFAFFQPANRFRFSETLRAWQRNYIKYGGKIRLKYGGKFGRFVRVDTKLGTFPKFRVAGDVPETRCEDYKG
jgi:hypothetical protein